MRFKYLPGKQLGAQNPVNDDVAQAIDQSESQATHEIFGRTMHDGSTQRQRFTELLDCWHQGNEDALEEKLTDDLAVGDFSWMRTVPEKERFDDTPENIDRMMSDPLLAKYLLSKNEDEKLSYQEEAEAVDRIPALRAMWAEQFGVDPATPSDEFVRLCKLTSFRQMEEVDLDSLRAPSATVFWAKELVGRLPEIIEREDRLESHPFAAIGKLVPPAHSILFEQAHMLYLFDFDIPCVLTCGTLVEELVEKEFPDLNKKWAQQEWQEHKPVSFRSKVRDIITENPIFGEAEAFLLNIWSARNETTHDPAKYLRAGRNRSEEILKKTRKVLEIFFETLQTQTEGN
jgi:hypothetical protein